MRLCLFRHGIAIDREHPDCPPDPERFLTDRGVRRTRAAAAGVATLGFDVAAIYTSPYVRARQTADLLAEALAFDDALRETSTLIWDREPSEFAAHLSAAKHGDDACVFAVGHNPHFDDTVRWLIGSGMASLKKASLAVLEVDSLRRRGAVLSALYAPRALRQLGRSATA